jgi:type IV secretory pathway VirB10-like protein
MESAGSAIRSTAHNKRFVGFAVLTSLSRRLGPMQSRNRTLRSSRRLTKSAAAPRPGYHQAGYQVILRNLNVQPTIKVPFGYEFNVRVNRNVPFEDLYYSVGSLALEGLKTRN